MGYERNDRRFEREPDRGYGRGYEDRGYGRSYARGPGRDGYDDDGRGFFERAGDEVRSWFGDEEAEQRRRADELADERYDREQGRDRFARGDLGGYRRPTDYPAWNRSNRDEGAARGRVAAPPLYSGPRYDRTDEGRQFDDGGYARDAHGYGQSDYAGGRADSERDRDYRAGYRDRQRRGQQQRGSWGAGWDRADTGAESRRGAAWDDGHADYRSWRDQQVSALDRDYDEYRRHHRDRFHSEFAEWRTNRQTQRDSLGSVQEHQEVVGSDGTHVGTVDHVRSDHILLTKNDKDAGGHHHAIPSSWIATVADKVTLTKTADEAKRHWRDTEARGGLFGGSDRDQTDTNHTGRHNLDRSFSGTY